MTEAYGSSYGRDLDLNLLRVFAVVADTGSVTKAAARLYLTQPAVSAALRRLQTAVGRPVLVRQGRGVRLSSHGEQLLAAVRPHLQALVDAALATPAFTPATSDRIVRLGLSDATEAWLLPPLLRLLAREAPQMRVIAVGVQFRTVEDALLSRRVDLAISVADALPPSIRRQPLYTGDFVCLYDPRHAKLRRLTEREYFAREHVIVSYNGDLRGIVEDIVRKPRRVRCALASFSHVGEVVAGSALLATVPRVVAEHVVATRPELAIAKLPFALASTPVELLWPAAVDDDPACRYLREQLVALSASSRSRRRS
ncbi:MAG TPA: LysR family transcriptional regulator [Kofleriaceae bacterium]|nr:LysR family transcriptional regulator [Kofleriaceae bacterium]